MAKNGTKRISPQNDSIRYVPGRTVYFPDYDHGVVLSGVLLDIDDASAAVAMPSGAIRSVDACRVRHDLISAIAAY